MSTRKKDTTVITLAPPVEEWKISFQSTAMRSSFCLALTQSMLEMLCAVADQVRRDRDLYFQEYGAARPNNWIASEQALVKRGLITRVVHEAKQSKVPLRDELSQDTWRLTPAGEALVALLKVTGIFIEADAAILKRARAR